MEISEENQQQIYLDEKKDEKIYLVTGGCGFLGSNIALDLIKKGFRVRIFDRVYDEKILENELLDSYIIGNIANYDDVFESCQNIYCVFHVTSSTDAWSCYENYYNINIEGTSNIVRACKKK